jgi:hypothetical protein
MVRKIFGRKWNSITAVNGVLQHVLFRKIKLPYKHRSENKMKE